MSAGYNKSSWILMITTAMKTILEITSQVYSAIELAQEKKWEGSDGETKEDVSEKDKSEFADNMNMAAFITDNTIIDIGTGILAILNQPQKAEIKLGADGNLEMEAAQIKKFDMQDIEAETPSSAIRYGVQAVGIVADVVDIGVFVAEKGIKINAIAEKIKHSKDEEMAKDGRTYTEE